MSFALIVYLIGVLEPIGMMSWLFAFFSFCCATIAWCVTIIVENEMNEAIVRHGKEGSDGIAFYGTLRSAAKVLTWIFSCTLFISIFVPSKETAYTMLAASGVESIVTDERVQQLGGKSLDVIEQWLDEMSPENEGE